MGTTCRSPHFGLILTIPEFHKLSERLHAAGVEFVIEPYVRFAGETGEQWTMFLLDPAGGNALEFKRSPTTPRCSPLRR